MAEFKLGRLRFVWKNNWTVSSVYYQDDVVAFGGKIYICVIGHTSETDFFGDFDISPPKWNLVSDGQTWKGDWQPQTSYVYDDIVKYGGRLYIAQAVHISAEDSTTGLEADIGSWQLFADGLEWKGDWDVSFDYKINDIVKYGGSSYVCTAAHISAATDTLGLEEDLSSWSLFNQGFDYKGLWSTDTRFKTNDVVRFGANTYIASTAHTSAAAFSTDTAYWTKFVDGFQYEDIWSHEYSYQIGDIVKYGGNQYIALAENLNKIPSTQTDDWSLFSEGFRFRSDWGDDSSSIDYLVGDLVRLGAYTYKCILDHNGQQPPNATYWQRFSTGITWRNTWLDDQYYYQGDVIRFGDNSYVCIKAHVAEDDDYSTETQVGAGGGAENSRPDQDVTGTYWNVIAVGSESSVLTTTGDMVYYSGAGPTRLPIGDDGQVLTVSSAGIPEWSTLDFVDDVYFVAEHGTDKPAPLYGKSIDRPYKTIRYATQQIERGSKNPEAAKLLELNRRFIQREIVEWTDKQIVDGTSPFTTTFDYNSDKCERDMGFIVDALIWDVTHGGNVRTREAALKYVNEASQFYTLGQEAETNASINYGLTVIANVLAQTAPAVNYQTANGDNSTAIVVQYLDATLTAETGVAAETTSLTSIITNAITAGVATNIPARLIKTTLLRISTGSYKEVLPIIVPAECCIMGDELRATNVQARTKYNAASTLTPVSDFKYTYEGIKHLETVIGDIVDGTTVTPETGNTEDQNQTWPYAETTTVAPAAKKLARNIRRKIDIGLGTKVEASLKPAYELADLQLGRVRDINLLNKGFIQEELIGYITNQYPNLKYSRTKCKQDTGFIIDAIAYDLTYGGNWMSVKAGEAYYEGTNLQINSSEKLATLAAYGYLKDLVQTVGRNITVTPTYQSTVTQINGVGGTEAAGNVARDLMLNIISIITSGTGTVARTYPSTVAASAAVKADFVNVKQSLSVIQEKTIDFINENFGSFTYKSAKCRRDLGLLIDDLSFDVALGTNYNGVFNGLAYQRPINAYNISAQRIETVGSIRSARDSLKISVTTDGSSATGSSNASARISTAFNEVVNIINNGAGNATALTFPSPAGVDQNRVDAKDNLIANKTFIEAEIIAWIQVQIAANTGNAGSIWYTFDYDSTKCARDVGFIVDAMCYDVLYGGTQATTRIAQSYFTNTTVYPAGQTAQTAAAYARLATVLSEVVQESSVTKSAGNAENQTTPGTPASGTEATAIDSNMQIIEDVITAGNLTSLPTVTFPSITWADAEYEVAFSDIASDKTQVVNTAIQYITTTYNTFVYDHAKCSRDLGIILDAAEFDTLLDTNFAGIQAALSYLRAPSKKIVGNQKTATIAANEYARQLLVAELGNATAIAGVNTTWEWVEDAIWSGSNEGGTNAVADQEVWNGIRQLELNKEFIVQEVLNHVDNHFKDRVSGIDINDNTLSIADTSWLSIGMPIKFYNDEDAGDSTDAVNNANLLESATYYVSDITSATAFKIADNQYGTATVFTEYGEGFVVEKAYVYNRALCARDLREYVDAMKWDLQWPQTWERIYTRTSATGTVETITIHLPGFYRTPLAARYYVNSVIGSQEEDFYYLRNGTGVRLQTLDGLRGDLSPANAYGTSRPTAGAYASLDPGWGPDDSRAWITARSPYVQNCTTFGFAAIGQKIDGALHNGGNDSMVSNDFTQVISDGIGAWITNNGRAELVSVFTYYSHIGYLAEDGGRIRGTNGNNSYGTFGGVAEGVDPDETAITAVVDNRLQYNGVISNVFTDGIDNILQVEYSHAGNDYTEATINIFGAGDSEILVQEDFRDEAVNQIRVIEVDDSTGNPDATAGGSGYLVATNTAQGGTVNSITLAATDGNLSTAYVGMKLYIISGAGVGQFGIVNTYNSGTKLAAIIKETDGTSGWDHVVPGTTIVSANSSSSYLIEPRAAFTAPAKTNSKESINPSAPGQFGRVTYVETSAQYTGVAVTTQSDGSGATFDVTRNGEKYYVIVNAVGTGYARLDTITVAGSLIGGVDTTNDLIITVTAVNADTGAITAFDNSGIGRKGRFVALPGLVGPTGAGSYDGASTWTTELLASSATWHNIDSGAIDDGTTTFAQSYAVAVGTNGGNVVVNYSADTLAWTGVSSPFSGGSTESDVAFGQIATAVSRFIVIGNGSRNVAYSDNGGVSLTVTTDALPATGYNTVTYGAGLFVALKSGSQAMAWSADGITWTEVLTGLPATTNWTKVVFGNGRFVAVAANSNNIAYSLDGKSFTAVATALVSSTVRDIAYGQGMFVVTTDDTNQVSYSEDGVYWPAGGYTLSDTYTAGLEGIAFGNDNRNPKFVAIEYTTGSGTTTNILNAKIGATTKGRSGVANGKLFEVRITDPGSGYGATTPTIAITDPNNIDDVLFTIRMNDGVLGQPTFVNRGSSFITATAEVDADESNGSANFLQDGQFVAVRQLSATPVNGSNIVFDSLPNQVFKLVNTVSLVGTIDGDKTAFLQVSPPMEIEDAVGDQDPVTMRIRFSQVRLTGHDFLDVGTGNTADTNYPGTPVNNPVQTNETVDSAGGRVFFTSTDQDGNFKVGDLFSIEQATGVATLNAEAFNIAGLQELSLGEVTLGGNSASVTEFSTDPFFTANSDNVVPTQRAIKAYIEAQIGGGGASLIVNSVTAGDIFVNGTQITTVSGSLINIKANVNFQGAVLGKPLAYNYFLR